MKQDRGRMMTGTSANPTCQEAEDARLLGAGAVRQREEADRHREACARCQDAAAATEEVVAAVAAVDTRLDDVTRARIGAGLARRLNGADDRARRTEVGARRRAAVLAWWLLPAAGAAAAAWLVLARPTAKQTVVGSGAVANSLGQGRFDRIDVPAGTRARARLGRADLTLIGPAQVEVTSVVASDVTLRLSSGTMLGDYDGRAGGRLRVETPSLVADIVGTRFAIEATSLHARVSVQHGRVAVRPAAVPEGSAQTMVGAGQSWEAGQEGTGTVPVDDVVAALWTTGGDAKGEAATPPSPSQPATAAAVAPADASSRPRRVARLLSPPAIPASPTPATVSATTGMAANATTLTALPIGPSVPSGSRPVTSPVATEAPSTASAALVPAPLPPPAPPPAAGDLYRRAEEAMARHDRPGALRLLEGITTVHPHDPAADTARFELARDALTDGAPARAGRWADELIARGRDRSLVESARFLKCRIALQGGEPQEARVCLERFRADHPRSVRDQEALAALIRLAGERGACADATVLTTEHLRLYPAVRLEEPNRARCPR